MEKIELYEQYADCVIVCPLSGAEYPMIKQLLIIKSEYFRALFSENWKASKGDEEKGIKLVSPISLSDKIGWKCTRIYLLTGNCPIQTEELCSCLEICSALMITSLFDNLRQKLVNNLKTILSEISSTSLNIIYEKQLISFDEMVPLYQLSFYHDELNDNLLQKIHFRLYVRKLSKHFKRISLKKMWPLFSASVLSQKGVFQSNQSKKEAEWGLVLPFDNDKSFTLSLLPTLELNVKSISFIAPYSQNPFKDSSSDLTLSIIGETKEQKKFTLFDGEFQGAPNFITLNETPEYFVKFIISCGVGRSVFIQNYESTWRKISEYSL